MVTHFCPYIDRFKFNCYLNYTQLIVRAPDSTVEMILIFEGVIQGYLFSMEDYVLSFIILIHHLKEALQHVHQNWYVYDASRSRQFSQIKSLWKYLSSWGTSRGYFCEHAKPFFVKKTHDLRWYRGYFSNPNFKYVL